MYSLAARRGRSFSANSALSTINREVETAVSLDIYLHIAIHNLPVSMAPGVGRAIVIVSCRGLGIEDGSSLSHDSTGRVVGKYHMGIASYQPVAEICEITLGHRDLW